MGRYEDASDAEVIAASRAEPHVFEIVFDRHFEAVLRFATSRVGPDHAADVTAEAFVRAFDHRGRFDTDRPSALPWLFGIAVNVCREHQRKALRGQRAWSRSIGSADRSAPFEAEAADRVDAAALRTWLEEALTGLSEDEYAVLMLAAVGDMTYQEISEKLGIPIGTVRSRLSRARRRVRELLGTNRPIRDGTRTVDLAVEPTL